MKISRLFWILLAAFLSATVFCQPVSDKVSWKAKVVPLDICGGESAQIVLTATIKESWHIYGLKQPPGPISTEFKLKPNSFVKVNGEAVGPKPLVKFDKGFNVDIGTYSGSVSFGLPISIDPKAKGTLKLVVEATSQACDARSCDIPSTIEVPVEMIVEDGPAREGRTSAVVALPDQPQSGPAMTSTGASEEPSVDTVASDINKAQQSGLLAYLWLSFVFGLLALLTPCVWPMVPITVSFFSKRTGEGQKRNLAGALAYCLGIVGTFTLLGLIVTLIFGASGVQKLASNWAVNLGLAILFVVLALSLFGLFEFALPASWTTKLQRGSSKGGWVGPVLMGLTFSLTTFTCTVPFVGTILVSATKGDLFYPIVGMVGFSLAFAIPFFFLALFPQYLAKMPRSGSWLSAVKAYMGFLELAAAMKFLSNADLVWGSWILTRPIYLVIWSAIFLSAALYLFGIIRFSRHEDKPAIGMGRKAVGLATVAISGYCIAAIYGAPMGIASAFLPPLKTEWLTSFPKATQQAKEQNKAIFINFTGYTCTNCRVMEQDFFPKEAIKQRLTKFITVELFTDNGSKENNDNAALREKLARASTNPTYVILDSQGKVLKIFQGLARNEDEFVRFLDEGKAAFEKRNN